MVIIRYSLEDESFFDSPNNTSDEENEDIYYFDALDENEHYYDSPNDPENMTKTIVPWTPEEIETSLWLDAADSSTITETGGAVSVWADKSGNGRNITPDNGAPITGTRTVGGLNVLDFDGSSSLRVNYADTTNSMFLMCVFGSDESSYSGAGWVRIATLQPPDGSSDNRIYAGVGSSAYGSASIIGGRDGNSTNRITTANIPTTPAIFCFGRDYQSNTQFWLDGLSIYSGTPVGNTPCTQNRLGLGGGNGTTDYLNGFYAEAILLDGVPDAGTRQKTEGYLAHKWGLTDNLPADHPYKSVAP